MNKKDRFIEVLQKITIFILALSNLLLALLLAYIIYTIIITYFKILVYFAVVFFLFLGLTFLYKNH